YMMRRDVPAVLRLAEELVDVSRERGLAQYQAVGGIMRGWARARSGDIEEGLAELRAAIGAHRATASVLVGFFAAELAGPSCSAGTLKKPLRPWLSRSARRRERGSGHRIYWGSAEICGWPRTRQTCRRPSRYTTKQYPSRAITTPNRWNCARRCGLRACGND